SASSKDNFAPRSGSCSRIYPAHSYISSLFGKPFAQKYESAAKENFSLNSPPLTKTIKSEPQFTILIMTSSAIRSPNLANTHTTSVHKGSAFTFPNTNTITHIPQQQLISIQLLIHKTTAYQTTCVLQALHTSHHSIHSRQNIAFTTVSSHIYNNTINRQNTNEILYTQPYLYTPEYSPESQLYNNNAVTANRSNLESNFTQLTDNRNFESRNSNERNIHDLNNPQYFETHDNKITNPEEIYLNALIDIYTYLYKGFVPLRKL
ncbi:hypothetical protein TSAR_010627, partial [Trichomalopsis sarcophagae]